MKTAKQLLELIPGAPFSGDAKDVISKNWLSPRTGRIMKVGTPFSETAANAAKFKKALAAATPQNKLIAMQAPAMPGAPAGLKASTSLASKGAAAATAAKAKGAAFIAANPAAVPIGIGAAHALTAGAIAKKALEKPETKLIKLVAKGEKAKKKLGAKLDKISKSKMSKSEKEKLANKLQIKAKGKQQLMKNKEKFLKHFIDKNENLDPNAELKAELREYIIQMLQETNSDESEENNWEVLVDENKGIYIPQYFIKHYENNLKNVDKEDIAIIKKGPEEENYWEAWDSILNTATFTDNKGKKYSLHQDGDLFAIPKDINESTLTESSNKKPIQIYYDPHHISMKGDGIHAIKIDGQVYKDHHAFEGLIEALGSDVPEFYDYEMSLYFGATSNAGDIGLHVDYDSSTPDKVVDKVQDWIRKNVSLVPTKDINEDSDIPHYTVGDAIFISYEDALDYCDNNDISCNEIRKTKSYQERRSLPAKLTATGAIIGNVPGAAIGYGIGRAMEKPEDKLARKEMKLANLKAKIATKKAMQGI